MAELMARRIQCSRAESTPEVYKACCTPHATTSKARVRLMERRRLAGKQGCYNVNLVETRVVAADFSLRVVAADPQMLY